MDGGSGWVMEARRPDMALSRDSAAPRPNHPNGTRGLWREGYWRMAEHQLCNNYQTPTDPRRAQKTAVKQGGGFVLTFVHLHHHPNAIRNRRWN